MYGDYEMMDEPQGEFDFYIKYHKPFRFNFNAHRLTMGEKRMLKLADMTAKIPPKHFDIGETYNPHGIEKEDRKPDQCGSVGCVMGMAAHLKLFKPLTLKYGGPTKAVLKYAKDNDYEVSSHYYAAQVMFKPAGKANHNMDFGDRVAKTDREYFGVVNGGDWSDLFAEEAGDGGPKDKARQLREYVKFQVLKREAATKAKKKAKRK